MSAQACQSSAQAAGHVSPLGDGCDDGDADFEAGDDESPLHAVVTSTAKNAAIAGIMRVTRPSEGDARLLYP